MAIEELADVRLALGEHALVIDALTAAIKEHPLRERLTESLMHALYRSGRQAEALRAYADLAHRLDEELGLAAVGSAAPPGRRRLAAAVDARLRRAAFDGAPVGASAVGRAPASSGGATSSATSSSSTTRPAPRRVGPRSSSDRPGIGKTTLVEEYCARIRVPGCSSPLVGLCDPNPAGDYQPVAEILRALVDPTRRGGTARAPAPAPARAARARRRATARRRHANPNAPGAHLQLFDAIAATLERLAESPIVLVIEDLHWADRPTLTLLRHLLRHPRPRPSTGRRDACATTSRSASGPS